MDRFLRIVVFFLISQTCLAADISVIRDPFLLLNQFYALKANHPNLAFGALKLLLLQDPNNVTALKEMGYWQLAHNHQAEAVDYFIKANRLKPDPQIALQIAYIDVALKQNQQAEDYLKSVISSGQSELAAKAQVALANIQGVAPSAPSAAATSPSPAPAPIAIPVPTPAAPPQKKPQPQISPRDEQLNQFYHLQKTDPVAAEKILRQLVEQYPNDPQLLNQMGYLQLQLKNKPAAIHYFSQSYPLQKESTIALQLGYLWAETKQYEKAVEYFTAALARITDPKLKQQASAALTFSKKALHPPAPPPAAKPQLAAKAPQLSLTEQLLNEYYPLKKTNPTAARTLLLTLLQHDPYNTTALLELAYSYNAEKNYDQAYIYFLRDYQITHNPEIAVQLGYVLDASDHKYLAYHYFVEGAQSADPALSLKSNQALTNLAGWNTRALPSPLFADVYLSPLYYGRFNLGVLPYIVRAGVYLDQAHRTELYTSLRYTRDNKSLLSAGVSPEIFEDDVMVMALGIRHQLFKKFPLYFYTEAGAAYDLVYRLRPRWRGDFRSGFIAYDNWGRKPTYQPEFTFLFKPVGDFYGDLTFYTRYGDDIIGTARVRQGFRVVEYHASFIDIYLKGQYGMDTLGQYYNNYLECGPGIAWVPNNRYNLAIRLEAIQGYYIDVNSPTPNPFSPHYSTNNIQLELYARF